MSEDGHDDGRDDENVGYDEDYVEDDENLFDDLGAANLQRVQRAMKEQLEGIHQRVTEDLRVKEEEVKRVKRQREDVGVELYGVQQQLAKLQIQVEKTHDTFNEEISGREAAEMERQQMASEVEKREVELKEQESRVDKFQKELDKLNATMLQVENYNERMKSEIAVARRVTYKAEEQITQQEAVKTRQDLYIDELTQRMKQLHEQLAIYNAQLESQQGETGSARETLAEAAAEMAKIRFEKKQLLGQWRSSLLAIARRDEELQSVENAIKQWHERRLEVEGEIASYKTSIRGEEEKNEKLVGIVTKVRNEASFLERQVESIREQRARLNEQYTMLKKSLDTTDAEFSRVGQEQKLVQEDSIKIDRAIVEVAQETQEVESTIFRNLSDQTTLEKDKMHVAKATEKMRHEIHRKENDMAQVQNELARIKVDSLNTIAHNEQLVNTLREVEAELKRKEQLIAKYELEIRRRTDELEKKMRDLDGLNRKFETIKQRFAEQVGAENAEVGPLEATIRNLGREIDAKKQTCGALQGQWMKLQTDLVHSQNEANAVSERVGEMRSKQAVLNQKRIRLEGTVKKELVEVKDLEIGISAMHADMSRLNTLIAQNAQLRAALEDSNFTVETEFAHRLRDQEEDAIRLEQQIVSIKEDKDELLREVLEQERQIMLLERKIELEKETQTAYNQEDDTGELIAGMKKEIHRMTLRYSQLMHRQEELMQDIERNIFKRENIALKGRGVAQSKQTAGNIKRVIGELSGRVRDAENEIARYDKQLKSLEREQESITTQLDDQGSLCERYQESEKELQAQIFALERNVQATKTDIMRHRKMANRFRAVLDGKYKAPEEDVVEQNLERARARREALKTAVDSLRRDPTFDDTFVKITEIPA